MRYLILILAIMLSACGGGGDAPINTAAAAERQPVIVAFGDSITAGYMPVDGVHQLRQDLSYTQDLKALGPVFTAAVGGAASDHGINAQAYWLRSVPADVVIVMFGINDAIYGVPVATTVDNIGKMFAAYPGAKRIVMAPPLWSDATRAFQQDLEANLRIQALIWGATYIDLYTPSADLKPWCTADRHPCADWHRDVGKRLVAAIKG